MKTDRRHDIDWLRVVTIALLLIYHIAIIFQPWAMFVGFVRSEKPLETLWVPMTMLNVWRIPILFFVSGMGLYFAMRKRNWKQLIGERSRRILVPFLIGIVAIAPLHMYLFQAFYKLPFGYYPHMGHLWFLGNIFAYVLLFLPIFYLLKNREGGKFKKLLDKVFSNPIGPLLISLFFMLEAYLVKPQIYSLYAETWHGFFLGALAFFFGYLFVYSGPHFWATVKKWKWGYLTLAFGLYILRYVAFNLEAPGYLMALESNCWIFGVFGLGYTYLNKPSKVLGYLSQAAYPVYIIHMFVMYLGAYLILHIPIHPVWQFLGVTVFTFAVCYLLYEFLIRRIWFLRPLFGLKGEQSTSTKTKVLASESQ
ncbi:acyltransferase family protein [Flagellimonas beolgyonensis]|uniref:acyltransferase family protein n=1 Tax=Flagellimonas beolgyonensis TaxID=864064 RepID=UPI000F8CE19E|nr:acyltransferase family protein [Allomuricauda beolgyonensis]